MRLELSRFVESDLDAIASFIAEDNPHRAVSFIREIRDKFRFIAQHPLVYQLRHEIGDSARVAVHGRYIILFRVTGESVRIERVVYGSRDLPNLQSGSPLLSSPRTIRPNGSTHEEPLAT
jgi:toxin ParE1/3/4